MRVTCDFVSLRVGRDDADRGVLAGARRLRRVAPRAQHLARVGERCRQDCARRRRPVRSSGSMMSPTALTATMAATTRPLGSVIDGGAEA